MHYTKLASSSARPAELMVTIRTDFRTFMRYLLQYIAREVTVLTGTH